MENVLVTHPPKRGTWDCHLSSDLMIDILLSEVFADLESKKCYLFFLQFAFQDSHLPCAYWLLKSSPHKFPVYNLHSFLKSDLRLFLLSVRANVCRYTDLGPYNLFCIQVIILFQHYQLLYFVLGLLDFVYSGLAYKNLNAYKFKNSYLFFLVLLRNIALIPKIAWGFYPFCLNSFHLELGLCIIWRRRCHNHFLAWLQPSNLPLLFIFLDWLCPQYYMDQL